MSTKNFLSPKSDEITYGIEDDWMVGSSAKRCLDDDFSTCNSEKKKKKIVVKQEMDAWCYKDAVVLFIMFSSLNLAHLILNYALDYEGMFSFLYLTIVLDAYYS